MNHNSRDKNAIRSRNRVRWNVVFLILAFGVIVSDILTYPPVFDWFRFTILVFLIAVTITNAFVTGANDALNKISKDLHGVLEEVRVKMRVEMHDNDGE